MHLITLLLVHLHIRLLLILQQFDEMSATLCDGVDIGDKVLVCLDISFVVAIIGWF